MRDNRKKFKNGGQVLESCSRYPIQSDRQDTQESEFAEKTYLCAGIEKVRHSYA